MALCSQVYCEICYNRLERWGALTPVEGRMSAAIGITIGATDRNEKYFLGRQNQITLYAFDVSFITGEKGRSFRWVVSGRQGKLASAPVYRCLRFLGLKGAHCFLRRRSCKHSLICEVVEELLHGVGETVHPAPKVVKRRTIWSTAALIFGPSCTLGRAGFS